MKNSLKTILASVAVFLIFALVLTGINVFAGPLIEKNGSAQLLAPLFEAMPEAKGFTPIYTSADAASSSLQNVAPTVTGIYEEESGLGYAVTLSTTEGYTGEPMEFVMAVDTEGKIVGTALTAYPETKDFGADYPATYIGQDSALADVTLVAGVTYSSAAFKNAVTDGFTTLIENGLVKEGVKGDDQLLLELLPTEFTGMANPEGVLQAEEVEGPACAVKTLKALNGSGFAFLIPNGESYVMAMVNAFGTIKITDAVGNAVDVDAIAEVLDFAAANQESTEKADLKKLTSLAPDGIGEMTALKLDTFGCVTAAYAIEFGEETLYGFRATPFAYANETVAVYYIVDASGAIVAMNCADLILHGEYFSGYELNEKEYKAGFAGLTADTWTGEQAFVSGATMTTDAIRTATDDIFAAFASIPMEGGETE